MKRTVDDKPKSAQQTSGHEDTPLSSNPEPYFRQILSKAESKQPPTKKLEVDSRPTSEEKTTSQSKQEEGVQDELEFNLDIINKFKLTDDSGLKGAFQAIIDSSDYRRVLAEIGLQGEVQIVLDDRHKYAGSWNTALRTITINPNKMKDLGHTMVGTLAFELMNARQDPEFQALVAKAKGGQITDPDEYARAAEAIEYRSASMRANASFKMIKSGKWTRADDRQLRHFLENGQEFAGIEGTGMWLTFEGYLDTQKLAKHYDGQKSRFEKMVPEQVRKAIQEARKIEEARQRDLQRQSEQERQKTRDRTISVKNPHDVLSEAAYEEFFRSKSATSNKGKTFEMNDGRICVFVMTFNDEYMFKIQ